MTAIHARVHIVVRKYVMHVHIPVIVVSVFVSLGLPRLAPGQAPPPYTAPQPVRTAQLFAPGIINTDADEYGPVFSADGLQLYFTRRTDRRGRESIVVSRFADERWTAPTVVSFSGQYYDKEPFVAPGGDRLFFASTRPDPPGGEDRAFDLWFVDRTATGWGDAIRLDDTVNSDDYDNYPSVARNGNLYFGSRRAGGLGRLDLYVARFENGRYQPAENLGPVVNSEATDADPYVAPDESYLIFSSTRAGGVGSGDLYMSVREGDGWSAPHHLGAAINSDDFDYTPVVSPDGRYLFFSRGWGDIYFVEMDALPLPRE